MARDPEKHRKNNLRYYYRNQEKIKERKRKRYAADHEEARAKMDPGLASRMSGLRATPRRKLHQSWTSHLFARMSAIIEEDAGSRHTKKSSLWAFRLILEYAEKSGLTQIQDLSPGWLAGFPLQTKDRRKESIYRADFSRMLMRLGPWSQEDYELCKQNLKRSFRRSENRSPLLDRKHSDGLNPAPSPPHELCQLVRELAYRCGLPMAQIRELRVAYIQPDGLRIPPKAESEKTGRLVPRLGRFIPFGNGWDELRKIILDEYVSKEKPTDYLFFSRAPRDKKKPLSKMTLNGAVIASRTTIKALCNHHFEEDFELSMSLQEARFHFRNVHHLNNQFVHNLVAGSKWHRGYVHEAETIPVPVPYLLAAMCVSRSISEETAKNAIPEGGKRALVTWPNLLGYEISVDWTRGFARDLRSRGQKSDRTLRLLYRLAFDFWFEGRRMKLPDVEECAIRPEDADILQQLAATTVVVRDVWNHAWAGRPFEYGNRKRAFRIPLIEDMHRRAWHNQCMICWHPERDNIEQEISKASAKESRKKGYHLIGSKYGVSNLSLAGHRGRKSPRRGKGETPRSHFWTGPLAAIARCPRRLFEMLQTLSERELVIYSLLLIEKMDRSDDAGLIASTNRVEECVGLRLSESQLSIALNHLGPMGAGLIDFRRDPKGFSIDFPDRALTNSVPLSA